MDTAPTHFKPNAQAPIAIFGGKGSAEVAAEYLAASGAENRVLGFLNDQIPIGEKLAGYDIVGAFEDWSKLPDTTLFLAPLHKAKEAQARLSRIESLGIPADRWTSAYHPHSSIAKSAVIGPGANIGAYVNVSPSTTIGRHVSIRASTYVGHDVRIRDFVFVGAGAAIAGYSQIGDGAFIGMNAVIQESTKIGKFAVVGMGAVVTRDVADYEIVVGNPARTLGHTTERPVER